MSKVAKEDLRVKFLASAKGERAQLERLLRNTLLAGIEGNPNLIQGWGIIRDITERDLELIQDPVALLSKCRVINNLNYRLYMLAMQELYSASRKGYV